MASYLSPQVILLAYWLVIIAIAAFFMRLASSLCQADIPSWPRAVISVVVVTGLAYLTFDFSAYLILLSIQDTIIQVPPGYTYSFWFREAIGFKWFVIGHAGPLKWLPPIFAACVAGILQVIVLQADVKFRWGLIIYALQMGATAVAGYILSLVLGLALDTIGWHPDPVTTAQHQGQVDAEKQTKGPDASKGKSSGKHPDSAKTPGAPVDTLKVPDDAAATPMATAKEMLANLHRYADSHLEEVKETLAPVTRHLPEPVNHFLDAGGWWGILGVLAVIALLWLRSLLKRIRSAWRDHRKRRRLARPRTRTRKINITLKEKLSFIGEALTEEPEFRVMVNQVPARLRLVVLSLGTKNGGQLTEEMSDRVLDWIKPGLAEATSLDYPRVRVWPPFFSAAGFAQAVRINLKVPEKEGEQTPWALLVGQVQIGKAVIHVTLAFYLDEPNTMRIIDVRPGQWLSYLAVQQPKKGAKAASRAS